MNDRASVARWLSVVKTYEKSYWALPFLLRSAHRPRWIWDKTAEISRLTRRKPTLLARIPRDRQASVTHLGRK